MEIRVTVIEGSDCTLNVEALEEYPNVCEVEGRYVDENIDIEVMENEDAQYSTCITFHVGDAIKVKKNCLFVLHMFLETCRLKHPATQALYHGEYTLSSLGSMSHACKFCGAQLWKGESRHVANGSVGKHCCSDGKVCLLPLLDPPLALKDLLHGDDAKSKAFKQNICAYNNSLAFLIKFKSSKKNVYNN